MMRRSGMSDMGKKTSELEKQLHELREQLSAERAGRERAESLLDEIRTRYRSMLEFSPQIIIEVDRQGNITYANPAVIETFGYSLDKIGTNITEFIPAADLEFEKTVLRRGLAGGRDIIVSRVRAADGKIRHILNNSAPIYHNGEVEGLTIFGMDITERMEAVDALRESEERYRTLAEAARDYIYLLDTDLTIRYVNNEGARQFHARPEDIIGKSLRILFPQNAECQERNIRRVLDTGEELYVENSITFPGGEVWLSARLVPVRGRDGGITGVLGISRDITQRKRTEQALRESEERFRSLFESAKECIFVKDAGRRYVKASPAMQRLLGLTEHEIIGRTDAELFNEAAAAHIYETDTSVLGGAFIDQEDIIEVNGVRHIFHATKSPIRNAEGDVIGLCGIARDVSDRKKIEEELRESERKYRTLVEAASDGIAIVRNRKFLYVNRRLAEMIGYAPDALVDTLYADTLTPDQVPYVIHKFRERFLSDENAPNIVETTLRHRDGADVPVELNIVTISYELPRTVLIMVRDITERRRAEQEKAALQQQLLQSQKMEAIGTLAGGMAHDFNNALAVILGTAEVALRKTGPGDPNHTRFEKIVRASERARHITSKLLTFSRKQTLDVKTVDVGALVAEIIDMLRRSVNPDITIVVDPARECTAQVDANQMHQALLNIMINACEAMPGGGEVRVSVQPFDVTQDNVRSCGDCAPGNYCLIRIKDNGPGIPKDIEEKIFDPFFTTKDTGTGLGLSITLGIIKSHGGHVHVQSEPGCGAEMNVLLPAVARPFADRADAASDAREPHDRPRRVLIIDDDSTFTDALSIILEKAGFQVETAHTGGAGIALYSEQHIGIDVVLLDLILPDIDGAAVFRALKRVDHEACVIVCTGCNIHLDTNELVDRGVNIFLPKPFQTAELFDKIDEMLKA